MVSAFRTDGFRPAGRAVSPRRNNHKAKEQFDIAWKACGMDTKDITGMERGELFDQWLNGKVQDPTAFLKAVKL